MFILSFYVPEADAGTVKQACFDAGAGRIGNYDCCCWQTLGQGQFRPLPGSDPAIGEHGLLEVLPELRVEMVCDDAHIRDAVAAMKAAHPYEEVAFSVTAMVDVG